MAAEPHSTTRRALLGAAAAALVAPSPVIASAARQSTPASANRAMLDRHVATAPRDDEATWNRHLAHYRRLAARTKAEAETGAYRAAIDRYDHERAEIETRFGSWPEAWNSNETRPLCAAIFARITKAENAYADRCILPTLRAAIDLALTPVPDLQALLVKIDVMREHELESYHSMMPPVLEVLREDLGRLTKLRGARAMPSACPKLDCSDNVRNFD